MPPEAAPLTPLQRQKLDALLRAVAQNPFYRRKIGSGSELTSFPFTTRAEIEQDQISHPPYGTNLTFPIERYTRFHQTSGTGGRPVRWLDTPESWEWVKGCWKINLEAVGAQKGDRMLFPFSFGPFIGFWSAFEAATALGLFCIPAGGLSTSARLKMLMDNSVTIVLCTPTYALRMADTAREEKIDLQKSSVRALIVAGEPGGNVPEIRRHIESAWGAKVFDHCGMTETGPVGYECQAAPGGMHVIESEHIAEVIDPQTGKLVPDGQVGELVLTTLGRIGSPLIRYRTGDLVRLARGRCACGSDSARLDGGILARADDMIIVRGNNVFPSAIDVAIRQFEQIAEYRVYVRNQGPLAQVRVEIETSQPPEMCAELVVRVARSLQSTLSFRAEVQAVAPGTLPRFEMKAKRLIRES